MRDRCDALLTGVGTVLADDPALTTRLTHRAGRNPLRVIVDSRCRTPLDAQVVRLAAEDGKTLIATTEAADADKREALQSRGCQVLVCDADPVGPRHIWPISCAAWEPAAMSLVFLWRVGENSPPV